MSDDRTRIIRDPEWLRMWLLLVGPPSIWRSIKEAADARPVTATEPGRTDDGGEPTNPTAKERDDG